MASRFLVIPSGTFTDSSTFERVQLDLLTYPASRYIDLDPAESGTITKDVSNFVSIWRNVLGAEQLDVSASGVLKPVWYDNQVNGLPAIRLNEGGIKTLYSSANALHDLNIGYGWAAVVQLKTLLTNSVIWGCNSTTSSSTCVFHSAAALTVRNNLVEVKTFGALVLDQWTTLIGSYQPGTNELKMWKDGTLLGIQTSGGLPSAARKLCLGWNGSIFGDKYVARFQMYNAALSDLDASLISDTLASEYNI